MRDEEPGQESEQTPPDDDSDLLNDQHEEPISLGDILDARD
jgi:hypothetical protein